MADTWPVGDPMENGTDEKGGFFSGLWGAGSALGFTPGGIDRGAGRAVRPSFAETVAKNAQEAVLGQYPGYGDLWTYDPSMGPKITPLGFAAIAGLGLALYMLTGRR